MRKIYFNQLLTLVRFNLTNRFRNTFAGVIWVSFHPILIYVTQAFVFYYILNLKINHFFVYLFSGLLPFLFLSQTIEMSTTLLVNYSKIIKSYMIHPATLVITQVLDNFINFLIPYLLILSTLFFLGSVQINLLDIFFLPVALLFLLLFAIVSSIISSVLQVFFYDTKFILNFLFQILFYLTPVFYTKDFVQDKYRVWFKFNPFYAFIETHQKIFTDTSLTILDDVIIPVGVLIFTTLIFLLIWKKCKKGFYAKL